jgi:hypothetical protein
MKRFVIFTIFILALTVGLVLAQDPPGDDFPFELDEAIVTAIQTVFGIGMFGIIQLAKQLLKKVGFDEWTELMRHAVMYVVSLVIAAAITWFVLTKAGMMTLGSLVLYTVYAWGLANGFWKGLKEIVKKHSGASS